MKNVFSSIVAKSKVKPELTKVLIKGDYLAATNSYVLVEVNRKAFKDDDKMVLDILRNRFTEQILVSPSELDLEPKVIEVLPVEEKFSFPNYRQIIPTKANLEQDYYSIKVNPQYLTNMAKAIANTYGDKEYSSVTVHIPKKMKNKPMFIQREDKLGCGLVMPINR